MYRVITVETQRPYGQCTGLRVEKFCVLGQTTSLSQCLFPPKSKEWVSTNCQGSLMKTLWWLASHPGKRSNTSSHFMLREPGKALAGLANWLQWVLTQPFIYGGTTTSTVDFYAIRIILCSFYLVPVSWLFCFALESFYWWIPSSFHLQNAVQQPHGRCFSPLL